MKKYYEGASIISAIILVLTTVCIFVFNINKNKEESKARKHEDKKIEKVEKESSQRLRDKQEELDAEKKKGHPLWNYYDPEKDQMINYPGQYKPEGPSSETKKRWNPWNIFKKKTNS